MPSYRTHEQISGHLPCVIYFFKTTKRISITLSARRIIQAIKAIKHTAAGTSSVFYSAKLHRNAQIQSKDFGADVYSLLSYCKVL